MYLVTGGAGFIGSHIVHALVSRGQRVRVVDNLTTGRIDHLDTVKDAVEFIHGDIRSLDTCRKAMQDVRFVLHQAALPSVPRSIQNPIEAADVNIRGTLNILVAARDQGVERVVYASSSSVYGDTPALPKSESMTAHPQSPYAATKLAGEHFCRVFAGVYGLKTVSLRYFNVYGPRQDPAAAYAAVIPRFIIACLSDTEATIFGDGMQARDFTFVDDCVAANLLACEAPVAGGEVCNVGSGFRVTITGLYDTIRRIAGAGLPPRFEPARIGDVRHSQADITQARELLGYAPRCDLETGLARTLEWMRAAVAGMTVPV